jgi:hypothetical protein
MSIKQYLQNESVFKPDDIKVMSRALEDACKALNINGDARARDAIAIRIIELARRGEREPTKLRDQVVQEANGATGPVASVVPLFRDSGFDAEATQTLGKAYYIACRSLHPKGRPPVVQEMLAKKILEVAQRGERDPDRLAAIALGILGPFHQEVSRRFGLVPNFFMSAPDAPEIVEKLWDFAKSAYLESPIPSLFKERLFVFLSRFCQVRYCIVRHCGFLVGYGHASGDPGAAPQSIEQVVKLLKAPTPWRRQLEPIYEGLEAFKNPTDWPVPGSDIEDWIFAASALIFVEPTKSGRAQQALRQALGGKRLEYLLALLAFIRAAHYWTMVHPGLKIEDDVRDLMISHKELGHLLLQDPDLADTDDLRMAQEPERLTVSI